jgi:regulator of cell morphogenesis and NO signaling
MSNIPSHSLRVPSSLQLIVENNAAAIDNGPTLSQLVNQRPHRARFFEQLGLNYCGCGNNKSLKEACCARGLDANRVLEQLLASERNPDIAPHIAAPEARPGQLLTHISEEHHTTLRSDLARTARLVQRVANRHGQFFAEVWEIQSTLEELWEQLEARMERHECVLFPLCRHLINSYETSSRQVFGNEVHFVHWRLQHLIESSQAERAFLCEALVRLRVASHGFEVPDGVCTTYRVMLCALSELESAVQHLFEDENCLLSHAARLRNVKDEIKEQFSLEHSYQ